MLFAAQGNAGSERQETEAEVQKQEAGSREQEAGRRSSMCIDHDRGQIEFTIYNEYLVFNVEVRTR